MHISVNGAKLYFDVEGAGLVPDGSAMRQKPTLVMLHGGPGFDHSIYKPGFSAMSDIAQIIYYDHRGNGRSERGNPATWTLAQWGDDVKGLCDALGIEKPIVCGVSFGGFVAQAYATRHPGHPGKLVLVSTAAQMNFDEVFAAFGRIGGDKAREAASTYWSEPTPDRRAHYISTCFPLYNTRPGDPNVLKRAMITPDTAMHFNGPRNEHGRMDFRAALSRVACPTLVMAGDTDPITPMVFSKVIAASLPKHLVQFERFANCGHGVFGDAPEDGFRVLRDFIGAA